MGWLVGWASPRPSPSSFSFSFLLPPAVSLILMSVWCCFASPRPLRHIGGA
uniref:Uncharacterized protein n=1 Tax=Arundo donax TaxID=35708 RepID=A0A0A8Y4J3_ARUDO